MKKFLVHYSLMSASLKNSCPNAVLFRNVGLSRVFHDARYLQLADFVRIGAFIFVPILPRLLSSLARLHCACAAESGLYYHSDP